MFQNIFMGQERHQNDVIWLSYTVLEGQLSAITGNTSMYHMNSSGLEDVGDATRRGFSVLIHTFEGQFPFFGAKDYLLDVLLNILEFLVLGFYRNTK